MRITNDTKNKEIVGVPAHRCPNRGITLIALIITIIVMLILVAVTISMAINGGLFEKAGKAVGETENAINAEQELSNGQVEIDRKIYNSIDEYLSEISGDKPIEGNNGEKFSAIYEQTEPYTDKNGDTATIPAGFSVGTSNGINTIDTGLVIRDVSGNEFVWIPVTQDLGASYSYSSSYSEPKELTADTYQNSTNENPKYDSQEKLDELYGENYYNYANDFKYAEEYAEMVRCVNANHGFYIGRYETTIADNGSIGSKYNTTVLTAGTTLFTEGETTYPYRWYGLYYALKNANVVGNGTDVQTAMIYGVLYDKAMDFIRTQKIAGKTTYDVDTYTSSWHGSDNGHTGVVKSGQANPGTAGDVALNIWDLESNAYEWTQEAMGSYGRVIRGDHYEEQRKNAASDRFTYTPSPIYYPWVELNCNSARLVLYIK